jgi:hypothetical protein
MSFTACSYLLCALCLWSFNACSHLLCTLCLLVVIIMVASCKSSGGEVESNMFVSLVRAHSLSLSLSLSCISIPTLRKIFNLWWVHESYCNLCHPQSAPSYSTLTKMHHTYPYLEFSSSILWVHASLFCKSNSSLSSKCTSIFHHPHFTLYLEYFSSSWVDCFSSHI